MPPRLPDWDSWGLAESEHLGDEQLDALDQVARVMVSTDVTAKDLRDLYARDGFRVPSVVTSYSPAADSPLRVSLVR